MTSYKLEIQNSSIDGVTGHHTVLVRILEYDDQGRLLREGVPETYGIDHKAIDSNHKGDVSDWLNYVGLDMKAKHERRTRVHADLITMKGKILDLQENP